MSQLGVRFGKALQMTNVLRDIPRDLRNGRCYLPQDQLADAGLTPSDLLNPSSAPKARPVLVQNLRLTLDHYQCAEQYLLALPRCCFRLRLAVAWPLLMGLATLAQVARNPHWLAPDSRPRVSRGWVYRTWPYPPSAAGPTQPSAGGYAASPANWNNLTKQAPPRTPESSA